MKFSAWCANNFLLMHNSLLLPHIRLHSERNFFGIKFLEEASKVEDGIYYVKADYCNFLKIHQCDFQVYTDDKLKMEYIIISNMKTLKFKVRWDRPNGAYKNISSEMCFYFVLVSTFISFNSEIHSIVIYGAIYRILLYSVFHCYRISLYGVFHCFQNIT